MTHVHYLPDVRCLVTLQVTESAKNRSTLTAKLYRFDKSNCTFNDVACFTNPAGSESETSINHVDKPDNIVTYEVHSRSVAIIKCDTVHTNTHLSKQLVILLFKPHKQNKKVFKLLTLRVDGESHTDENDFPVNVHFEEICKFSPLSDECANPEQVHLLDGPVVLWLSTDQGCLMYTVTGSHGNHEDSTAKSQSPPQFFTGVQQYDFQHAQNSNLLTAYKHPQFLAVLLTTDHQQSMETDATDFHTDVKFSAHQMHFSDQIKAFHKIDSCPIPSVYAEIARCALVVSMRYGRHKPHPLLGRNTENIVLLCTSYGQLLCFKNGHTEHCVKIPFLDVCKMTIIHAFGGDEYVFLESEESGVCAVTLNTFKVVQTWGTVKQLVVGDFMGCGTDQAFMMEERSQLPLRFILTDLCAHQVDRINQVDIPENLEEGAENVEAAIHALSSRLQSGLLALQEAEQLKQAKQDMIEQTCKALQKMATGEAGKTCTSKGNLLPLVGCGSTSQNPQCSSSASVPSSVHVLSTEVRVVYDKLIISVVVVNRTKRNIYNLAASIVFGQRESDKVFISEFRMQDRPLTDQASTDGSLMHTVLSAVKRRKVDSETHRDQYLEPDHITQISSFTSLPKFLTNGEVELKVVLHWTGADSRDDGKPSDGQEDFKDCSMCGGRVKLTANELVGGGLNVPVDIDLCSRLTGEEIQCNITALNTIQERTDLRISSSVTNLSCLTDVLNHMNFIYHVQYSCWMVVTNSTLYLARIFINQQNRNNSLVTVHTRDATQTMLIVHTMYSLLPKDTVILPVEDKVETNQVMQKALQSLKAEVDYATTVVKSLLTSSKPREVNIGTSTSENGNTLEAVRQDFMRQKQHLIGKGKANVAKCANLPNDELVTLNTLTNKTDDLVMELFKQT